MSVVTLRCYCVLAFNSSLCGIWGRIPNKWGIAAYTIHSSQCGIWEQNQGLGFSTIGNNQKILLHPGNCGLKDEELSSEQNCLPAQSGSRLNPWPAQADLPCKGQPFSLGAWIHKERRNLTMALGNGGKNSKLKVFSGLHVCVSGGCLQVPLETPFSPTTATT